MDEYAWTDAAGKRFGVSRSQGLKAETPSLEEAPAFLPDYHDQLHRKAAIDGVVAEILRLADENARLKARVEELQPIYDAVRDGLVESSSLFKID